MKTGIGASPFDWLVAPDSAAHGVGPTFCANCNGSGAVLRRGLTSLESARCHFCGGTGAVWPEEWLEMPVRLEPRGAVVGTCTRGSLRVPDTLDF